MSIGDKIKKKSRGFADKISQQYLDHLSEEQIKKEKMLSDLEVELNKREKAILERENKIKKYYLIPKKYIQIPVIIILMAGTYIVYDAYLSDNKNNSVTKSSNISRKSVDKQYRRSKEPQKQTYNECVEQGILFYKELGSYPRLSSGENAERKVREMCGRSNMAF